jgi:hypothetical protein
MADDEGQRPRSGDAVARDDEPPARVGRQDPAIRFALNTVFRTRGPDVALEARTPTPESWIVNPSIVTAADWTEIASPAVLPERNVSPSPDRSVSGRSARTPAFAPLSVSPSLPDWIWTFSWYRGSSGRRR